jgi:MFS family permease
VNVIVYYSNIFLKTLGGFSNIQILLFSAGFGIINFVFAIPAFYTIDTFGRRSLLLFTFPFLALFQLWIAIAFKYQHKPGSPPSTGGWNNAWILGIAGMYLFGVAYSPGEGPVPFVYAAESMPLYIRDVGMGLVTSVNWLFNWLVAFTFPWFFKKFDVYGAFLWYAGWCLFLWVLIFLSVDNDTAPITQFANDLQTASSQKLGSFLSNSSTSCSRSDQPVLQNSPSTEHATISDDTFEEIRLPRRHLRHTRTLT